MSATDIAKRALTIARQCIVLAEQAGFKPCNESLVTVRVIVLLEYPSQFNMDRLEIVLDLVTNEPGYRYRAGAAAVLQAITLLFEVE